MGDSQFVKIKSKKTKCQSPYLETEIWDRDEILFIIKYESYTRNVRRNNTVRVIDFSNNHTICNLPLFHLWRIIYWRAFETINAFELFVYCFSFPTLQKKSIYYFAKLLTYTT